MYVTTDKILLKINNPGQIFVNHQKGPEGSVIIEELQTLCFGGSNNKINEDFTFPNHYFIIRNIFIITNLKIINIFFMIKQ